MGGGVGGGDAVKTWRTRSCSTEGSVGSVDRVELEQKNPFQVNSSVSSELKRCGQIHLIMGPMFAGKTTALLDRVKQEEDIGKMVLLVKSAKDSRYSENEIVSHTGSRRVRLPYLCESFFLWFPHSVPQMHDAGHLPARIQRLTFFFKSDGETDVLPYFF